MKKILLLICLCILSRFNGNAQEESVISGIVKNHENVPIQWVTVHILNSNLTTTTNSSGSFEFKNIPYGKLNLRFSAVGYATAVKTITEKQNLTVILQDAALQLDEITVSAQKIDENIQNVPLSISALSSTKITDYRIQNTRDLSGIIPSLYASNPGDGRNVTSIRGIGTTSYDPAVATYIDGVNQFNLDTYISPLFDVERIEVLRGPQGTLYGRNAMGGVINIITKQPTNYTTGFAGIDIANYGQQRYSLGLRTALIKDKLFFGVAGLLNKQDGFYTNEFTNTKFDKINSFLGNYYLKFLASSKFALTLNIKHNGNRNDGTFPLGGTVDDALAHPFKLNQNATTEMVDNLFNVSLSTNYYGKQVNFSSQTAYQSNYRFYKTPIDGDFSPIDGVSIINNYGKDWNKVQAYTQEIKFSSPNTAAKLKWLAGLYGFYQTNPVKQGVRFGADAEMLGAPFPNFTSLNTNTSKGYGLAAFGQVSYQLTDKFVTTLGLRYDYEYKKQRILGEFLMDGMDPVITQNDTASSANFKAFSPKITLAYEITNHNNAYASYSRGYRAGGISQLGSDPSVLPLVSYQPEFSSNYEIGAKNTFLNNKLIINIAAYYTRLNNAQVPILILPDAVTITKNVGKLTSKGIELETSARLFKGLIIDYNFGYNDAKYNSLQLSKNGEMVNLDGNRQLFTPDITSMLALQQNYVVNKKSNLNFIVRAEWMYTGDQFFDLNNQIEQKGYNLYNGKIGLSNKRFDLFLWSRNISNKIYIDYAYDFGATHLGNPRTYGLTLTGRF